MIGPDEHLAAQIAGFGIAPHRLFGGARQTSSLAFGAQHQACKGEVEGAGEPHQNDRGRADLRALDLADGGFGNPGTFGKIRQRPAAAVTLKPQAVSEPGTEIVYNSIHLSIIREIEAASSWNVIAGHTLDGVAAEPAAIISGAAVGGDNAPSDRVTPRNFRKTRKLNGAAEARRSPLVTEG